MPTDPTKSSRTAVYYHALDSIGFGRGSRLQTSIKRELQLPLDGQNVLALEQYVTDTSIEQTGSMMMVPGFIQPPGLRQHNAHSKLDTTLVQPIVDAERQEKNCDYA